MDFPYGKAPLAILLLAVFTGGALVAMALAEKAEPKPDLIMACFDKDHGEIYRRALPAFEKANNCRVQVQVVDQRALQNRLESAMEAGAPVPDMVELLDGTLGVFTKVTLAEGGFFYLNNRVSDNGL